MLGRFPGGGNGNLLQYSCLENPRIEEPDGLQSLGSYKSDKTEATSYTHTITSNIEQCFICFLPFIYFLRSSVCASHQTIFLLACMAFCKYSYMSSMCILNTSPLSKTYSLYFLKSVICLLIFLCLLISKNCLRLFFMKFLFSLQLLLSVVCLQNSCLIPADVNNLLKYLLNMLWF